MLFSIIIPVYNSEKNLDRCILSILSQTYQSWELILVDDGSKDRSGIICDSYSKKDPRIKAYHKKNGGVSKARNFGLDYATGDWVTFCDSDDELLPNALFHYHSAATNEVDIVRAGFIRSKNNSYENVTTNKSVETNKDTIIQKCYNSKYEAYVWNSCFRKQILVDLRFDETISWCEDHLFTFGAISKSRGVSFIPNFVYKYYAPIKGDTSFSENLSNKYVKPNLIIQEAISERDIKFKMCDSISDDCLKIINSEFNYKANLALRYAIIGGKYFVGLKICRRYLTGNYKLFISCFLHNKIYPIIIKLIGDKHNADKS